METITHYFDLKTKLEKIFLPTLLPAVHVDRFLYNGEQGLWREMVSQSGKHPAVYCLGQDRGALTV